MSYGDEPTRDYEAERDVRARVRQERGGLNARQDSAWRAMETLDNALDTLSSRLSAVLLPERPTPALAGLSQDPSDVSEHGAYLDRLTERLEALGRRVSELSDRIDL
jgi:hypothetical protein